MSDPKKPPEKKTSAGQHAANEYVRYESKMALWVVLGICLPIMVAGLVFTTFNLPLFGKSSHKKRKKMITDLMTMARVAVLYKTENDCVPESLAQLHAFTVQSLSQENDNLPSRDPWEQDYFYIRISENQAAVGSSGSNCRLDTDRDILSAPPENSFHKTNGDGIYLFSPSDGDDWIFLVGSWPSEGDCPKNYGPSLSRP